MKRLNGGNFYIDLSDKVIVPYVDSLPYNTTINGDFKTLFNNLISILDKKCVNVKLGFKADDDVVEYRSYLCNCDGVANTLYKQFYFDGTLCLLEINIYYNGIDVKINVI